RGGSERHHLDARLRRKGRALAVRGRGRDERQGATHVEGLSMRTRFLVSVLALALARGSDAAASPAAEPPAITSVRVELERPSKEKLPTLRFLKANRDFIRSRFDRLRQESREEHAGAASLDPRFLEYRRMLGEIA